jgi:cyclopropane-fatty-acyl-phospholipid synthase
VSPPRRERAAVLGSGTSGFTPDPTHGPGDGVVPGSMRFPRRTVDPLAAGSTLAQRPESAWSKNVSAHSPARSVAIDLRRWPALARPRSDPLRAVLARVFLRRVATRTGIRVDFPDGSHFGPAVGPRMNVREPAAFLSRLGQDGKIGFGESYMACEWDSVDLVEVLEALARHAASLVPRPVQIIRRWYEDRKPASEDNDRAGAARNIVRHYDLSNDLFATFLDKSMSYSAALFGDEHTTLAHAQAHKIERLLDAIGVRRGTRLLEVGTGWGELALRAAGRGARVTSVTLSVEQATLARKRVAEAGLAALVDIRVEDYRDLVGTYDAIVSVEMIEAVGEQWWPTFFQTLDRCLAPGGRIGLQSILMAHDRLEATKSSWTWIHKYIFPGGLIPSQDAIRQTMRSHTSLEIVDQLHFGHSYARTLQMWRRQFVEAADNVEVLGFDETFRRMWSFFLAYSEAGFASGYLDVAQFVLARTSPP